MTTTEILSNLCAYDSRNPGKTEDRKLNIKGPCYCDNCFYGRTKMAEEILKLREACKVSLEFQDSVRGATFSDIVNEKRKKARKLLEEIKE